MGALPNSLPQPDRIRKAPQKARASKEPSAKCKPRTWKELDAECRAGTDFEKGIGYLIFFHACMADLYRLSSGLVCDRLCGLIFQNVSRNGRGSASLPGETTAMSVIDCALLIGCDERSINRALEYLEERAMATVARLADSQFVVNLRYREWAKIEPSYREWDEARRTVEAEAAAEDLADDAPAAVKPGVVPITTAPRVVRAGHRERSLPITSGTKSFRFDWNSPGVDLRYTAAIHSGEVVVTACLVDSKAVESKSSAKPIESDIYTSKSGHGCPNGRKIPSNEGSRTTTDVENTGRHQSSRRGVSQSIGTVAPVQHPRAQELSSLFDPFILKSCGKTLSGDHRALLACCEAIGDASHDYVVKAVVDRAARPIASPRAAVAICVEIQHNWQRSEVAPAKDRLPTQEERDAMVDAETRQLAAKRRELTAARRKGK